MLFRPNKTTKEQKKVQCTQKDTSQQDEHPHEKNPKCKFKKTFLKTFTKIVFKGICFIWAQNWHWSAGLNSVVSRWDDSGSHLRPFFSWKIKLSSKQGINHLIHLASIAFFWQRIISFTVFFVRSINERYHIWALLATAPSVVQWSVRLVPCESMTSDKQACGVICDTGSPYPCVWGKLIYNLYVAVFF